MINLALRYYFYTLAFLPLLEFIFYRYIGKSFVYLYGFAGTVLFLYFVFTGKKFRYPKYTIALFVLTIYYFGWALANGSISNLRSGIITYFFSNTWLHTVTFLLLVENTIFDDKFIKNVIVLFKITIIIAFIVSLIQFVYDPFFFTPDEFRINFLMRDEFNLRLPSIFGFLTLRDAGASFIPIMSILIGYYLFRNHKLHYIWLVLSGFVFFATKSRWIYLNFIIILLQYPLLRGINFKKVFWFSGIALFSALLLIFLMKEAGFDFERFLEERLLSESASTRFLAVEMFSKFFPQHPFFGSGIHVSEDLARAIGGRSSQIHIGYLSHLYEFGIVGSAILFYLLYLLYLRFYHVALRTRYYGSLFALIAYLAANLTLVDFSFYHYGFMFAFIFNKYVSDFKTVRK